MKRRDYLLLSSLGGVTGYKLYTESINTAYASINQFNIVGDDSLDQSKTNKLQFNPSRLEIETSRLNDNENATLTFEAKYQDESEYTTLESKEIDINSNSVSDYSDEIEPVRLFGDERLSDEQLQENDFDDFQMRVSINHPDIQEISQTATFRIGLVDLGGSLEEHDFGQGHTNKTLDDKEKTRTTDTMRIWSEEEFKKLTKLVSAPMYENKSSNNSPQGIIDWSVTKYEISPRNTGEQELNEPTESHTNNEMNIWSEDEFTKLTKVVSAPTYENKSSNSSPKGIIDWSVTLFEISPRNTGEQELNEPTESRTNNEMNIWSEDEFTKLTKVVSAPMYENKSSNDSPKGIIDWSVTLFEISPRNIGQKELNDLEQKYI